MTRFSLSDAQVKRITEHIQASGDSFVKMKWRDFLTQNAAFGFSMEEMRQTEAILVDLDYAAVRTFLANFKPPPVHPPAEKEDTLLAVLWEIAGEITVRVLLLIGNIMGLYACLPTARTTLRCLAKLIGTCMLAYLAWIFCLVVWSIDLAWIAGRGQAFTGWVSSGWAYAGAACWSGLTGWNVTLPSWKRDTSSAWQRDLDVNTRLEALDARVGQMERSSGFHTSDSLVQLSRKAGIHMTPRLDNLDTMVADQRKEHVSLKDRMKDELLVYNQKNTDLTKQLLAYKRENSDLVLQLQKSEKKVGGLSESVRILINRMSCLELELKRQEQTLARVEATGMAAVIMAGATTIVGAVTAVTVGGYLALGKMALGYALTVLCEYGSLSALADEPIQ